MADTDDVIARAREMAALDGRESRTLTYAERAKYLEVAHRELEGHEREAYAEAARRLAADRAADDPPPLASDPYAVAEHLEHHPAGLPHLPGCTDPDHRPLTSLCTTEPYRVGAIGDPT